MNQSMTEHNRTDDSSAYHVPRLLADVGGTNARFALEYAPGKIEQIQTLASADFPNFTDAVSAYLQTTPHRDIKDACVAIANPVQGDMIHMTNHPWQFSIEAARRTLHLDTLLMVNDFTALAMSLPYLDRAECIAVGGGQARADAAIGLVGAGTGLGVGGLIPADGRWIPLDSEGGHATFAPSDEREIAILQYCWRSWPHVSAERLVSGSGIELIYQALGVFHGHTGSSTLDAPAIVKGALEEGDPLCLETIECFCAILGTVASNVALTLGAFGGIYIGGGIVPRLGKYFSHSPFRARFEAKGRFSDYLSRIPTFVITAAYPAFVGAGVILKHHLLAQK